MYAAERKVNTHMCSGSCNYCAEIIYGTDESGMLEEEKRSSYLFIPPNETAN